ncbi:MAG TPA: hypothetical protein PLU35_13440 [Phycisphaerales bacterium]|nr:hypothetical protein [Phycisphaerales bacterium]
MIDPDRLILWHRAPEGAALLHASGDAASPLAVLADANPLTDDPRALAAECAGEPRLLIPTGQAPAADPAEAAVRTWSRQSWATLSRFCAEVAKSGLPLWLLPAAGDVLSDAPRTAAFMAEHPGLGFVLEPAALLTPAMLDHADDHLHRFAHSLGHHPACAAIFISDAKVSAGSLVRCPVGRGAISARCLAVFVAACRADLPVVLLADAAEEQLTALADAARTTP